MPELDFSEHDARYGAHALHPYAAKCPPPLVRYGLRYYSKPGETVLDPMAGSGTTLAEARRLGRHAIGYDIDPLARLIAEVKLSDTADDEIEKAFSKILKDSCADLAALKKKRHPAELRRRAALPDFTNRDYWFDSDVAEALALLRHHISSVRTRSAVRRFLWVAFSSLILAKKSVANARDIIHSRHHYFAHEKPPDVLARFRTRVDFMRKRMDEFRKQCGGVKEISTVARLGDARRLGDDDESVDLVFFSPPYATALDYPRAHFLAVAWMEKVLGVDLEKYRSRAGDYIGSNRGAARDFKLDATFEKHETASRIISALADRSARNAAVIQRYFLDMAKVVGEAARVLKRECHVLIVVCPSHIRKLDIPTHNIFVEIAGTSGLALKNQYSRTIDPRRRLLPYMQKEFGKRMSTEYVLIFRKES
jgi:16S rRNA G966 N2-methylase RsmD